MTPIVRGILISHCELPFICPWFNSGQTTLPRRLTVFAARWMSLPTPVSIRRFWTKDPRSALCSSLFQNAAEPASDKSAEFVRYVSGLVTAWRSRYQSVDAPNRSSLTDPLSTREAAILKLIAQGLSNKEIARSLDVTPETVKSHVKNIFIKLGAEKRAQAVARAQSLGLITTH